MFVQKNIEYQWSDWLCIRIFADWFNQVRFKFQSYWVRFAYKIEQRSWASILYFKKSHGTAWKYILDTFWPNSVLTAKQFSNPTRNKTNTIFFKTSHTLRMKHNLSAFPALCIWLKTRAHSFWERTFKFCLYSFMKNISQYTKTWSFSPGLRFVWYTSKKKSISTEQYNNWNSKLLTESLNQEF